MRLRFEGQGFRLKPNKPHKPNNSALARARFRVRHTIRARFRVEAIMRFTVRHILRVCPPVLSLSLNYSFLFSHSSDFLWFPASQKGSTRLFSIVKVCYKGKLLQLSYYDS